MAKALILVVEDEKSTAGMIREALEGDHYNVSVAHSVQQAQTLLKKSKPDLLILDRNLPDHDGLDLCKELRANAETKALPVIFLTGKKALSEKVVGLRMGADDYLAKPFQPEELVARVEALLRRTIAPAESATLTLDALSINLESRTATMSGKKLPLTNKEFDLLRAYMERPGRVLTRAFLISHVWGYGMELELDTKSVDMMVMSLRRKLGKWGDRIEAVRGYGYRLRGADGEGRR